MSFKSMTQTKLAEALGKHRSTIDRWRKAGLPANPDGKTHNLSAVVDWLIGRERESVIADQAMAGTADSPALERYRMARAAMAEMDLKIKEGELIPVDEVHRQWALRIAEVAGGLETFADRLPPLLVGKEREQMRQVIDGEVWRLRDVYSRNGKYCER